VEVKQENRSLCLWQAGNTAPQSHALHVRFPVALEKFLAVS